MKITTYKSEIDDNKHNILVKESTYNYSTDSLQRPQEIAGMLNTVFRLNKQAEEYVYMVALDVKNNLLGVFEISHGSHNRSICSPREIFIKALLCGASGIILAHNHPSGNEIPSKADIEIYKQVKEAGELIGIKLLDNIIIGNDYFSFAEEKL